MSRDVSKQVEVVLALPHDCWQVGLDLMAGATVADAVRASGLDQVCCRQTGQPPTAYGIHGRKVAPEHIVAGGDRIELYRPLVIDPRERRRRRVRS